jgi:hypothetical protein
VSNNGWSNQSSRRLVLVVGTPYSGIFFYDPTIGGGNLILSIVPAAGTDPYGNVYAQGITIGKAGGDQVVMGLTGGQPLIYFPTGASGILNAAAIQTIRQNGTGAAGYDQIQILGAENSTQLDSVLSTWLASSTDGTQQPQIQDYYHDPAGVYHLYRVLSFAGDTIAAGSITAVDPTTGTSRANAAKAETWHAMTLTGVFGQPAAPFAPPRYRLEPEGGGKTVRLSGAVTLTGNSGAFATFWDAPTAYGPKYGQHFSVATKTAAGANSSNVVNVTNSAPFQVGLANGMVTGDTFFLDGITYVLD